MYNPSIDQLVLQTSQIHIHASSRSRSPLLPPLSSPPHRNPPRPALPQPDPRPLPEAKRDRRPMGRRRIMALPHYLPLSDPSREPLHPPRPRLRGPRHLRYRHPQRHRHITIQQHVPPASYRRHVVPPPPPPRFGRKRPRDRLRVGLCPRQADPRNVSGLCMGLLERRS